MEILRNKENNKDNELNKDNEDNEDSDNSKDNVMRITNIISRMRVLEAFTMWIVSRIGIMGLDKSKLIDRWHCSGHGSELPTSVYIAKHYLK